MPFTIVRNDITAMQVDAIVNAANSSLAPGGGVCGAIFAAAGREKLERECRAIGHCDVGSAVLTKGYDLPARHVIHAVGPIWQGGDRNEAALLRSCYLSAMELAEKSRCKSIAFPLISAGIYGYPKEEALRIAVSAIRDYLAHSELEVTLVLFDRAACAVSEQLMGRVRAYIDDHYADLHRYSRSLNEAASLHQQETEQCCEMARPEPMPCAAPAPKMSVPAAKKRSLRDLLGNLEESFSKMLLRLIDEKGMTDVEVYKRANLDRKLFSKLRKDGYNPSKQTAIALAIALRLNLDETKDFLGKAGFALSHSNQFDVIIEYFITEEIYDIYAINEVLFAFEQKLLGA